MLPFEKTLVDAGLAVDQLIWVKTDAVASNSHSSVASSWEHLLVAYNVKSRHDRPHWQQHFHNFPPGTTSLEKGCFLFKKRVPAALKVRYTSMVFVFRGLPAVDDPRRLVPLFVSFLATEVTKV